MIMDNGSYEITIKEVTPVIQITKDLTIRSSLGVQFLSKQQPVVNTDELTISIPELGILNKKYEITSLYPNKDGIYEIIIQIKF